MSVLKSSDEIIEGIDDATGVPREWGGGRLPRFSGKWDDDDDVASTFP